MNSPKRQSLGSLVFTCLCISKSSLIIKFVVDVPDTDRVLEGMERPIFRDHNNMELF